MSEDLLNMLAECESAEDLAALEALAAELPVQPEQRIVRTTGEVAAVLGVQPQTVRAWRMESPPMPGEPGKYSLSEITRWRDARTARTRPTDASEIGIEIRRAQLVEMLECARGRKMKNDRLEAQLISREELERDVEKAFNLLERKLATLPERVAGVVPAALGSVISEECQSTVEHALKELRNNSEIMAVVAVARCEAVGSVSRRLSYFD
jgi:hypothetical protein